MRTAAGGPGPLPRAAIAVGVSILLSIATAPPASGTPGRAPATGSASSSRGGLGAHGAPGSSGAVASAKGLDGRLVAVHFPVIAPGVEAAVRRRAVAAIEGALVTLVRSGLPAPALSWTAWPTAATGPAVRLDPGRPCPLAALGSRVRTAAGLAPSDVVALVLGPGTCGGIGWRGHADLLSRTIAVVDLPAAAGEPSVWLHELGHLLGLDHAGSVAAGALARALGVVGLDGSARSSATRQEAADLWPGAAAPGAATGDRATVMGTCACGFAAHELLALGSPRVTGVRSVPPASGREMRVVLADPLAAADPELPRLVFLPLPDGVGLLLLELDDPRAPDLPPGLHGRAALHVRWLPNDRRSLDAVLRVADLRPGAAWSTPDGRLRLHFVGLAADGSGSLLVDRR